MSLDLKEIKSQYEKMKPDLVDLRKIYVHMLQSELRKAKIDYFKLESRVKTTESVLEKIKRKGKYLKPLKEMGDLIGIRIIVSSPIYIIKVINLIKKGARLNDKNVDNKIDSIEPKEFNYRGAHLEVGYGVEIDNIPFEILKVEYQIKTIYEHSWSYLEHKLKYKGGGDVPRKLLRKWSMLSSLLELSDNILEEIHNEHIDIECDKIRENIKKDDTLITEEVIIEFLKESDYLQDVFCYAELCGVIVDDDYENVPITHFDDIIKLCEKFKIRNLGELKQVITFNYKVFFDKVFHELWTMSEDFVLLLLIIFANIERFDPKEIEELGVDFNFMHRVLKKLENE